MPELTTEGPGKMEPNLTPLLDVVLQLLMFFVISVNFKTARFKGEVKLPHTQSAVPFEKSDDSMLIINMKPFYLDEFKGSPTERERLKTLFNDGDPVVSIPLSSDQQHRRLVDIKFWLIDQYGKLERESADGQVKTFIILRADNATDYRDVYDMMQLVKNAGFRKVKLGATYQAGRRPS